MKKWTFLVCQISIVVAYGQNTPCPCCGENYRQFDFWVGDWETTANGQLAGTNHIIILQDSCLIQENWKSTQGNYTGTSYNFYDPQDNQWHQTWVDNQGQSLRLSGNLEEGKMILKSGAMKNQNGETVHHKITWTPDADGTVRQLWESQKEGSESWQVLFDSIYKKKK